MRLVLNPADYNVHRNGLINIMGGQPIENLSLPGNYGPLSLLIENINAYSQFLDNKDLEIYVPKGQIDLITIADTILTEFESIEELQKSFTDYEFTVMCAADIVIFDFIDLTEKAYMIQSPNKMFSVKGNSGVRVGYVNGGGLFNNAQPLATPFDIEKITIDTFKDIVVKLLGLFDNDSENYSGIGKVYGEPHIQSKHVVNSTVCGPSYICPNSSVSNSYIGPGSVIIDSHIKDSEIYGSYVAFSTIRDSKLHNVISNLSTVTMLDLAESVLPAYTNIILWHRKGNSKV